MGKFLEPLDDILELSNWFESSKKVLEKLLETFQGKPDIVWWSKIISKIPYGPSGIAPNPGGPCDYGGWLVKDFLGLGSRMDLADMPSGINVVPLTIPIWSNMTCMSLLISSGIKKITK